MELREAIPLRDAQSTVHPIRSTRRFIAAAAGVPIPLVLRESLPLLRLTPVPQAAILVARQVAQHAATAAAVAAAAITPAAAAVGVVEEEVAPLMPAVGVVAVAALLQAEEPTSNPYDSQSTRARQHKLPRL